MGNSNQFEKWIDVTLSDGTKLTYGLDTEDQIRLAHKQTEIDQDVIIHVFFMDTDPYDPSFGESDVRPLLEYLRKAVAEMDEPKVDNMDLPW